jgi:hypothetical protein
MSEADAGRWRRGSARAGNTRTVARPPALLALALALGAAGGCTTTLVPPAQVRDPVSIFLLDHGRTPSLVLPAGDGGMVRYAYGDWNWYALRQTGPGDALAALFWPTRGALGRRQLAGPADARSIRRQLNADLEHIHEILVERTHAQRLRENLDRIYQQRLETKVITESVGLAFVHHPRRYTALHNSNHAAARWLRYLGVQTRGMVGFSSWRVAGRPCPR